MAVLVGLSRLYLYVHFPTDVMAGAALGTTIGIISTVVFDAVLKRKPQET